MRWPFWAWFMVIGVSVLLILIACRTIWKKYQARWPWLTLTLNVAPREQIKGE